MNQTELANKIADIKKSNLETTIKDLQWASVPMLHGNRQWAHHAEWGSLTVLDRMTGSGYRDIETGYRNTDGVMWIASGNIDIRTHVNKSVREAIQFVKDNANTCKGD